MATIMTPDGIRRVCKQCGRTLPLDAFHKSQHQPHGANYTCKHCMSRRSLEWRERLRKRMLADPDHPKHGTITGYQAGCPCFKCRQKSREYQAQKMKERQERAKSLR